MDRLDAMQVLLAAVDAGSLSAGSRKLNAPLPSVSRKVAELERHLGTTLLIRTSRKLQLTDAGRDFVDAARQIVAQLADAERRAAGEYDEPRGELSITVPGGTFRLLAVPLILEFIDEHPKISLNIIAAERNIDLIEERVDVGIRLGDLADSSLYAVKVGEAVMSTVASPAYLERKGRPIHPAHLSDHDGILFGSLRPATWTYSVDGKEFNTWPRFRVRSNALSTCIEAAVRGLGVTRLARSSVEQELRSGALTTVLEEYECVSMPVHLVYVKQGLLPLKVRAFLDWMKPRLKQKLNDLNTIRPDS